MSQSELAERANITEGAVGLLERGARKAPHRHTILLLAQALGLEPLEQAALENARNGARRTARSSSHPRHNLRPERTPLVGREAELELLRTLLGRSRLVCTTGSGGVGKTRIATEAARSLLATFPEVWFIDFASLVDGAFIPSKIADTIQPPLGDRGGELSGLASAVGDRHMLVIFDNCEHVIEHAARAADAILSGCPGVTLLATSRERLNVAGEIVYRLPSLSSEFAAELFTQRAQSVDPNLVLDAGSTSTITEIARRLDGIPLALELSAAHVPSLGLDVLRARLDEHLSLPSGRRDLPPRQRTVTATIDWSYNLLDARERGLLLEMGIFTGGFTLAAAEVIHASAAAREGEVLELLASLVNKSLVNADITKTGLRYSILESVRAFTHERLRTDHAYDAIARRHATWLAEIGDRLAGETIPIGRVAELSAEFDNVRAAVAWSLSAEDQDDRALAGRILVGLQRLWTAMGRDLENVQWLKTALARIDEGLKPLIVLRLLSRLMDLTRTNQSALAYVDRALRLCERCDDVAVSELCDVIAAVQAVHGDLSGAEATLVRSGDILIRNGMQNSRNYCNHLFSYQLLCLLSKRYDEARVALDQAEIIALRLGIPDYVAQNIIIPRIDLEYAAGNKELALEIAERLLGGEFGAHPTVVTYTLPRLIILRLLLGKVRETALELHEYLRRTRSGVRTTAMLAEVEYAALGLALLGNLAPAARLLGLITSVEKGSPVRRSPLRQDAHDLLESTLRETLDREALDAAMADGALLTHEDAIELALDALIDQQ